MLFKSETGPDRHGFALVKGEPKVLNLKEVLECYLEHQIEVITRRTKFDLEKAEARAHILEGLLIALNAIDEVIALIKASRTAEIALSGLMSQFRLSELQAKAILVMQLQKLTGLEIDKIKDFDDFDDDKMISPCENTFDLE